jgi:hypothetical protein
MSIEKVAMSEIDPVDMSEIAPVDVQLALDAAREWSDKNVELWRLFFVQTSGDDLAQIDRILNGTREQIIDQVTQYRYAIEAGATDAPVRLAWPVQAQTGTVRRALVRNAEGQIIALEESRG